MKIFQTKLMIADYITLLNLFCGLIAVFLAIQRISYAIIFPIAGFIFDSLDGIVARKTKPTKLGGELDSFGDYTTYLIAPIAIVVSLNPSFLNLLAGMAYAACGAIRLSCFNLQEEKNYFIGLPSPAAMLVNTVVIILKPELVWLSFSITGLLMISCIRIPKIKYN